MTILVVCAAGASSTFVALRLRAAAAAAGRPLAIEPVPLSELSRRADAELVLVGPHLDADVVRAHAGDVPVVALTTVPRDDPDGQIALALVVAALDASPSDRSTPERTGNTP